VRVNPLFQESELKRYGSSRQGTVEFSECLRGEPLDVCLKGLEFGDVLPIIPAETAKQHRILNPVAQKTVAPSIELLHNG